MSELTEGWRQIFRRLDDVAVDNIALDHFSPAYDLFGRGMGREEKIAVLVKYCEENGLAEELKRKVSACR